MMNDPFRVSINVHERRMFDAHQYVHGFQSRLHLPRVSEWPVNAVQLPNGDIQNRAPHTA